MVTQTSKQAYAHTNLTTQREQVAEYLLQRTFDMRLTSDREISEALDIPLSQIPARRQELIETPYRAHGVYWMPALSGHKRSRAGRKVQAWVMVKWKHHGNMLDMKRDTIQFITKLKSK